MNCERCNDFFNYAFQLTPTGLCQHCANEKIIQESIDMSLRYDEISQEEPFVVQDNGKPARYPFHSVDVSWNKCRFKTFQEAVDYANKWLGEYGPIPENEVKLPLSWDYSGYGDFITIKEY